MSQGYGIVKEMEHVKTESDVPVEEVLITDCGELSSDIDKSTANGHVCSSKSHIRSYCPLAFQA